MKIATIIMFLFLFYGCSNSNTEKIGVDFIYDKDHPRLSPEIHLDRVPSGVDYLEIQFMDATNNWEHGGGTIPYQGKDIIRQGAVKDFKGLSSTWGFPKFNVTVNAFDKNGNLIGKGEITKKPPQF